MHKGACVSEPEEEIGKYLNFTYNLYVKTDKPMSAQKYLFERRLHLTEKYFCNWYDWHSFDLSPKLVEYLEK